jgi:hypothetical protein
MVGTCVLSSSSEGSLRRRCSQPLRMAPVFRAVAPGMTTVVFGLTRAETAKAFESRRYTVQVR